MLNRISYMSNKYKIIEVENRKSKSENQKVQKNRELEIVEIEHTKPSVRAREWLNTHHNVPLHLFPL